MLNWIWLAFLLIAVLVGGFTGRLPQMTEGAFTQAKDAVLGIALPLVGVMVIWLGIMRLAERSGLILILSRALRPILRRLFPDVPPEHPAMGAMVMNMAANMLGLNNAATPLGLRAMGLLNQLNPRPGVASNAMVTFLTINTASIQLLPTTAIGLLAVSGAKDPTAFVPAAVCSSFIALTCGVAASKLLARLPLFAAKGAEPGEGAAGSTEQVEETTTDQVEAAPLRPWGRVLLWCFVAAFLLMFFLLAFPATANAWPIYLQAPWRFADHFDKLPVGEKWGLRMVSAASTLAVPFVLTFLPLYAALRGVKVYEQFVDGAKEAFPVAQRIIPFLVSMLLAIRMLRDAGVTQAVTSALSPLLFKLGFPADLLPLVLLRPLSGSATQGVYVDLIHSAGADSLVSRMASAIYGSTETTFYVIAVYFGSVAVRQTRHAIAAGLIADSTAVIASVAICRLLFPAATGG